KGLSHTLAGDGVAGRGTHGEDMTGTRTESPLKTEYALGVAARSRRVTTNSTRSTANCCSRWKRSHPRTFAQENVVESAEWRAMTAEHAQRTRRNKAMVRGSAGE